ncbi:TAXI family TRAP transporter solute-binding subunit [Pleurocapsa sp. PCC 7319]|uniref:TAXI family TRAP transporter solute-binding subunit n=1 Tax=Pleurocapsa sp. PCC 7319 TaxID=118161 RepID=UPI0003457CCC|nr:TAXI family TRAP transporter solute-binding subunit [Pleurocapsa sp. PCC 7319]
MKRKSFIQMLVASALFSPIISSGCSNNQSQTSDSDTELDTSDPELSAPDAASENQSLILTTATTGGTYYPVGVAIATLISQETPLKMNAIDSAGSAENIQLLKNQEADLAILQALFSEMAWSGKGQYEGQPEQQFRSITMLWPNVEHFIVKSKAVETGNIQDLENYKGKAFSIGKRGSGTETSGKTILQGLGFDVESDFRPEHMGYSESAEAMQNGRIEAMNIPAGPPASAVSQTYASMGADQITVLEFTPEQLNKINGVFPVWQPYTIEAGVYPNQQQPIQTIAQPNLLAVHPDIDSGTVYQITKTIYENLPKLKQFHQATQEMDLNAAISGLTTPLHPGAIQYYQEKGLTIPEHLSIA